MWRPEKDLGPSGPRRLVPRGRLVYRCHLTAEVLPKDVDFEDHYRSGIIATAHLSSGAIATSNVEQIDRLHPTEPRTP